MDDGIRKTRGALVDELQSRMEKIKRRGRVVPEEWKAKLGALAESTSAEEVGTIREWMHSELPPEEYETEVVTWDIFKDFASELIKAINERGQIAQLLTPKLKVGTHSTPKDEAAALIKAIIALRSAKTPLIAMQELGKIRAKAADEFPDLIAGE